MVVNVLLSIKSLSLLYIHFGVTWLRKKELRTCRGKGGKAKRRASFCLLVPTVMYHYSSHPCKQERKVDPVTCFCLPNGTQVPNFRQ